MTGYIFQLIAIASVTAAKVSQTTISSELRARFEFRKHNISMTTNTTMMDSGDPLVVIFSTNGLRVHSRCVGQNGAPEAKRRGVTKREMETRVSFPMIGRMIDEERRRGSRGV